MIISLIKRIPLIEQIAAGLVIGIITAVFFPSAVPIFSIFGDVFVKALKGVAPVLVFILVMNAMLQRKKNGNTAMKPIIILYILSTFASSLIGVGMSFLFPTRLLLRSAGQAAPAPSGISEVIYNLIMNIVDNPVHALETANYISILAWAIIIGMALHTCASETTKKSISGTVRRHYQSGYLGNPLCSSGNNGTGYRISRCQRTVCTAWLCEAAGYPDCVLRHGCPYS